jgi:hypothetical protein
MYYIIILLILLIQFLLKVPPSPRHTLPVVPGPPLPLPATPVNPSMMVATTSGIFPAEPAPAPGYSPPASPFLISEPQPPLLPTEVVPVVAGECITDMSLHIQWMFLAVQTEIIKLNSKSYQKSG